MSFYIFPNAIPKNDCKNYLDYCLSNSTFKDATIIKEGFSDTFKKNDTDDVSSEHSIDKRKTDVSFITDKDNIMNELVWGFIRQANSIYFKYKLDYFQPIQFARYEDGGHYDWHQDASSLDQDDECRKLSLTFSLTDHNDYDGGLLQFYNGDKPHRYKDRDIEQDIKSVGSVIVFDSRDWHRVTPVTRGVRYSIVCWTIGPHFV
jgi:PKHD-type hydroxylase